MHSTSPDGALVTRALGGDGRAAEELAGRHVAAAWRAAFAITGRQDLADDAVQDGFERAFAALERFDVSRPFGPWVNRIVANRAITLLSRAAGAVEFDEAVHGGGADHDVAARELREALRSLDDDRRAVVVLRLVLGFSPEETAEITGVPVGTVHSRLHRALADLRRLMEVPAG